MIEVNINISLLSRRARCECDVPRLGLPSHAMPVIPVSSQIFDLAFHPTSNVVYTGLLDGSVKAFTYNDDHGTHSAALDLRISKRSCRGLALSPDGSSLYAVGKNRAIQCVYTSSSLNKYQYPTLVPLTPARDPCPRHARVCTSELNAMGPAVRSIHPPAAHPSTASCILLRTSSPPATTTVRSR